jgi:predicted RNA-binding Zn-ribbon protein involved in translation (DUF1610 family)
VIDLDRIALDFECPKCGFFNGFFFRDARLRDVLICRGCKANIQLDDHMNECRKAHQQVNKAMRELEDAISSFKKTITFKF